MAEKNKSNYLTPDFRDMTEIQRMRFAISRFKAYDKKRKTYVESLQNQMEDMQKRIEQLELLTEKKQEQIDELIEAYETARPLVDNPKQKAYVYRLLEKISSLKAHIRKMQKGIQKARQGNIDHLSEVI